MQANKRIVEIIGFPMDLGADRRGVDMGPSALRIAGIEKRLENLGYDVIDHGDLQIQHRAQQKVIDTKLKYLDEIVKTGEVLANRIQGVLNRGNFPLCIGGDHSMSLASIAGVSAYCRDKNKRLGVLWVDAHPDMNTDQTTPSGNIHGMPMAASLGYGHDKLTGLLGFSPKIKAENCALIGIRSIDIEERKTIIDSGLEVYSMSKIDQLGVYNIMQKIIDKFKGNVDHLHVSFDVDSLDPRFVPGVGTPVAGGLSYREAHMIMESVAESGMMCSLEVAEVNPILDVQNQSAETAVEIVASGMGQIII
ncbi:arginase [Candidatus Uabimicrobium amorphum]|uniref:Arginase n=1 Tax=Uabimicrobium amorphum TaxID=2596890 RepID=A0A5S9IHG4_UABAM|nr:arginase [Candidatus Uabimicrobium amorphum]BBM81889.1 arginase [Candidatus Uabimicrobium amorphum]